MAEKNKGGALRIHALRQLGKKADEIEKRVVNGGGEAPTGDLSEITSDETVGSVTKLQLEESNSANEGQDKAQEHIPAPVVAQTQTPLETKVPTNRPSTDTAEKEPTKKERYERMLKALEPFPEFSKKQKVNVNIAENLIIRLKNVANANLLVNNKKAEINHVVNNIIAAYLIENMPEHDKLIGLSNQTKFII